MLEDMIIRKKNWQYIWPIVSLRKSAKINICRFMSFVSMFHSCNA